MIRLFGPRRPRRLAYVFERFPSFTQTFCAKEVLAVRAAGIDCPAYSIRRPGDQPAHAMFADLADTVLLPESFDAILETDAAFRRAARSAQEDMRRIWGSECEKRRIYEALWLKRELKPAGIAHVHTHFAGIGARTAFWLHRLGGPGFSLTAHANDIFCDEPPERLASIFSAAACVVTVSDFSQRYLACHFPAIAGKLHRVYNGIRMDDFPPSDIPAGRPLVVSVGRLIEKKGFADLIAACGLLRDRDFECRIIGEGPLDDDLRARIHAEGLDGRVILHGPAGAAEIAGFLGRARAFALPCVEGAGGEMDNLPTVIAEAMAAGLPVVSTPLAGIPEMVVDRETGFLVPPRAPGQLADALRVLMDSCDEARRLGAAGMARCRALFSVEETSRALIGVFRGHGLID